MYVGPPRSLQTLFHVGRFTLLWILRDDNRELGRYLHDSFAYLSHPHEHRMTTPVPTSAYVGKSG